MLTAIQERFATAIRTANAPPPADVTAVTGDVPRRRFDVYRDNVMAGLSKALASRFPASVEIVGEAFFLAMARAYVAAEPPRSAVLLEYGDTLPAFVEGFEPAATLPYLPDVLRLEVLRAHAYHAADAEAAGPAALAMLDPTTLDSLRVRFHPATGLLRSRHPVVTIWSMNAGIEPLAAIDDWRGEDALVTRPMLDVRVHRLAPGRWAFLSALRDGATLGGALEAALTDTSEFDAGTALAGLVNTGAITAFH
jgi:hypothetical protein